MISKDSIETAYSFLHQKWNVYRKSTMPWQQDDIEYIIGNYADEMDRELYTEIAQGKADFLKNHLTFATDLESAVERTEQMLGQQV